MPQDRDRILLRAKDISLVIAIITLVGLIIGPLKQTVKWDQASEQVERLRDKLEQQGNDMAVIKAQYNEISKQLDSINWQLRRMNRNG